MPSSDGGPIVHFMPKLGVSACGLTFARFPNGDPRSVVWLCTTPGHREYASAYPKEVNCEACKPAVVDDALKRLDLNECTDCGIYIGPDSELVCTISGDGEPRCPSCDKARLHPKFKR